MTTQRSGHGSGVRSIAPEAFAETNMATNTHPGLFGRMFPTLPPLVASDAALEKLAVAMKDANGNEPAGDNLKIPAGFTYLGQFIDHDITLDLTSLSEKQEDPLQIENFRTPGLDLDCLYGLGPNAQPALFERQTGSFSPGPKFLIGTAGASKGLNNADIPALPNDLQRSRQGYAVIGDHRNDENLVVAQTHLAMLKFHNVVVDRLEKQGVALGERFERAREQVRWHYQWLVLNDFVARLVEPGVLNDVRTNGRLFYRFKTRPYMPVEFSVAAYRLGHSMVREVYDYNSVFRAGGLTAATLELLFSFTGLSGQLVGDTAPRGSPLPQPTLPSNWVIDWRRFFDFGVPPGSLPGALPNHSRKLDPFIVASLHTLPGIPPGREANLAFRNLRRGVMVGLPSGQSIAAFMKKKKPSITALTPAQISTGPDGQVAKALGFDQQTPLWYYILKEAQVLGNGERLGPVGSRIVAEVFVGLVQGDKQSFMNQPGWKPGLPSAAKGDFTMTDLLRFTADISPTDNVRSL